MTNAVAFIISSDQTSDGDIADEFNVTYTLKTGVASTNKRKKVFEGQSYKTTLSGVEAGDTVTVTMGGATVTTDVYTASTGVADRRCSPCCSRQRRRRRSRGGRR